MMMSVAMLLLLSVTVAAGEEETDMFLPAALADSAFNSYLAAGGETGISAAGTSLDRCGSCGAPGKVGPILIVYLTYGLKKPYKSLDQVKSALFGIPGYADILQFASWGQTTLQRSDVDYLEMESSVDPDTWGSHPSLGTVRNEITKQQVYKEYKANSNQNYQLEMFIQPGDTFQASAYVPGKFSRYRGASITWHTMAHEIGHNWGVSHAGGYLGGQRYQEYLDDALMGYQRSWRSADFTSVARYNLGWIDQHEVANFPSSKHVQIRALNEGPQSDGGKLVMLIPCTTCKGHDGTTGGNLFLSFRVKDPNHIYGVELDDQLREKGSDKKLTLIDRVHVHFQNTGRRNTELWSTIASKRTLQVPGANLWVHVCSTQTDTTTEHAIVKVSSSAAADAEAGCSSQMTTTTTTTEDSVPCLDNEAKMASWKINTCAGQKAVGRCDPRFTGTMRLCPHTCGLCDTTTSITNAITTSSTMTTATTASATTTTTLTTTTTATTTADSLPCLDNEAKMASWKINTCAGQKAVGRCDLRFTGTMQLCPHTCGLCDTTTSTTNAITTSSTMTATTTASATTTTTFTTPTTTTSTEDSLPCSDDEAKMASWQINTCAGQKAVGHCGPQWTAVAQYCRHTCELCSLPCLDNEAKLAAWQINTCEGQKVAGHCGWSQVKKFCRHTCGFCDGRRLMELGSDAATPESFHHAVLV